MKLPCSDINKRQWLERFIARLTSQYLRDVGDALDIALKEWEPYWQEISPEDAADTAMHFLPALEAWHRRE